MFPLRDLKKSAGNIWKHNQRNNIHFELFQVSSNMIYTLKCEWGRVARVFVFVCVCVCAQTNKSLNYNICYAKQRETI